MLSIIVLINQKFYNEEQQWPVEDIEKLLALEPVLDARRGLELNNVFYTSFILGKKVVSRTNATLQVIIHINFA